MRGSAFVADKLAAELEFALAVVDPEEGQAGSRHPDGESS
jgi:hypothetical protein